MIEQLLILLFGLALIIFGADVLIKAAKQLSLHFNISPLVIGLTIVAIGTSMPELVVNLFASLAAESELALGNILGSNIVNLTLVVGVAAFMTPISIRSAVISREIPFLALVSMVLAALGLKGLIEGDPQGIISRTDAVVLLVFFSAFLYNLYLSLKLRKIEHDSVHSRIERIQMSIIQAIAFLILGLVMLNFGGRITIQEASELAITVGISEFIIGATIIALGTALPEIITIIVAQKNKATDIALGSIIGSNVINIVLILALSALIAPINVPARSIFDITFLVSLTFVFWILAVEDKKISRSEGLGLIFTYIFYLLLKFTLG